MSVRCIDRVLNGSQHSGTALLMLVVLADYSDDEGISYPAVASLARKCRMSARNANYILSDLQGSGELKVLKNQGPKGTNRYRLNLSALSTEPLKPASPLKAASPLKPVSATPEAHFPKPLKPTSDEPSLNRQEPREGARARKPKETAIPDSFGISAGVKAWATAKGFGDLDAHLEHFTLKCKAKGYTYADWDAAFKTAIRADWAGLRTAAARSPLHSDDNLGSF